MVPPCKIPLSIENILKEHNLKITVRGQVYLENSWHDPNVSALFGQIGVLKDHSLLMIVQDLAEVLYPLKKYPIYTKQTAESVKMIPVCYQYRKKKDLLQDYYASVPWWQMGKTAAALWNSLLEAGVTVAWTPADTSNFDFHQLLELAAIHPEMAMSQSLVHELEGVSRWTDGLFGQVSSRTLHYELSEFSKQLLALDLLKTNLPEETVQDRLVVGVSGGDEDALALYRLDVKNLPLDRVRELAGALRPML